MTEAYKKGYEVGRTHTVGAGFAGVDRIDESNPYPPETKEAEDWQRGYDAAMGGW